ncbi:MAG: CorA family divalent cation transporter [Rikenellaceae bacterium]
METKHESIFLLGGADLEMETIKSILDRCKVKSISKCSTWNDATIDKYTEELDEYKDENRYNVYGIELRGYPSNINYTLIDHHNENESKPSALEQVAKIVNISLSEYEKLVAANDRGYIPEMLNIGANQEQIKKIREADRKAQGITAEDEKMAELSISNSIQKGNLTIIKSLTDKFASVRDKIEFTDTCKSILIYNDSEFTFYGESRDNIKEAIINMDGINDKMVYSGGGEDGFVGIGKDKIDSTLQQKVIDLITTLASNEKNESYHIFMFPFQWGIPSTKGEIFSEQIDIDNINFSNDYNWVGIEASSDDDRDTLYNEKGYFYEFVHHTLYESPNKKSLVKHFERVEPKHGGVTYTIKVKPNYKGHPKEAYVLKADAINLNIYSTGVGVLSFYLSNDKHTDPEDITKINQFGRRLYPPFIDDINGRAEIAEYLRIDGLNSGVCYEDFKSYTNKKHNTPSSFVVDLINQVATNIEVKPVVDDRMFIVSWYRNIPLASTIKSYLSKDKEQESENKPIKSVPLDDFMMSEWWYKYVFIDGNNMMCQNREMQRELMTRVTYKRWQNWGSLYGISRYSIVMLSNAYAPYELHLYKTVETIYARMAELCLVQRASVLRFSSEVSILSNLQMPNRDGISHKVSSLYQEYIRFVNQVHFREITAQEQGIELYDMIYKEMKLEQHIEKLDNELEELHNHISLKSDRRTNSEMTLLTVMATIFIPATVLTGFYGMNNEKTLDNGPHWELYWQAILVVGTTILALIALWIIKRNIKRKL